MTCLSSPGFLYSHMVSLIYEICRILTEKISMPEWFKPMEFVILMVIAGLMVFILRRFPKMMAGVPFISPKAVQDRLAAEGKDILVIDVRTPDEFRGGHIPNALNLPLGDLSGKVGGLAETLQGYADTPVFLVCRTSNRAASAARILKDAGLRNLSVINGGMVKWTGQGLPVKQR